jgi:hypothetical protein
MTTLEQTPPSEEIPRFAAWLPDEVELRVAVKRENDQWFALQLEFDITGCGATRAEAVRQSFELLIEYLHAHFEEGAAFADAIRPIPRRLRVQIVFESILARTLRHTMLHLPLTDESTYSLPPGLLPQFAS